MVWTHRTSDQPLLAGTILYDFLSLSGLLLHHFRLTGPHIARYAISPHFLSLENTAESPIELLNARHDALAGLLSYRKAWFTNPTLASCLVPVT